MTGQGFQDLGLQATSTGGGCACCSPTSHATAATDTGAPAQQTAAGETVSAQFLVSDVAVDLHAGGVSTVTVSSATPVDAERVRAAVEEAGYSLAAAS
jgi:copper chaperone